MEIDAWTPGTSNIGSEGGGGVGFLWQDPLCDEEGKKGGHRLPPQSTPGASVCGMLGRTPQGLWKSTAPAILAGHPERQIAGPSVK